MKARPTPEEMLAYALGEFPPAVSPARGNEPPAAEADAARDARALVEAAAREDPTVREEVERMRALRALCEGMPAIEPAPGGFLRLQERLRADLPPATPPGDGPPAERERAAVPRGALEGQPPVMARPRRRSRAVAAAAVVVVAVALVAGGYFFFTAGGVKDAPPRAAPLSQARGKDFRRALVTNQPFVVGAGVAAGGPRLRPGDRVAADAGDLALTIGKSVYLLEHGGEVEFQSPRALVLARGALGAIINLPTGETVTVSAPPAVVEVKGTRLWITRDADAGRARVAVFQGEVSCRGARGEARAVRAGECAEVSADGGECAPPRPCLSLRLVATLPGIAPQPTTDPRGGLLDTWHARLVLENQAGTALPFRGWSPEGNNFSLLVRPVVEGAEPLRRPVAPLNALADNGFLEPGALYAIEIDLRHYRPEGGGAFEASAEYIVTIPGDAARVVRSYPLLAPGER